MQTIFYTFPLLVGILFEEVIPPREFTKALVATVSNRKRSQRLVGVEIDVCNTKLLGALQDFSPKVQQDGSVTRSKVHHIVSEAFFFFPSSHTSLGVGVGGTFAINQLLQTAVG